MEIELDMDRIMREEAWVWLKKISKALRELERIDGSLDSGLLQ
jgi:hypothetical protein